jgi:hypothetical protein
MHKRTREVKEEEWVERGKGPDTVKEVTYGRREKTKGKTFRKGRLIERRENRQRGRRNVQVEIQEKSTGRLKDRIRKR